MACTGGLSPSTQRAYQSGKKHYLNFCRNIAIASGRAYPLSARGISTDRKSPTSSSKILLVSSKTLTDFTRHGRLSMPHLELVVRGLKQEQAGIPQKVRLPIILAILRKYIRSEKQMLTGITLYCGLLWIFKSGRGSD